MTDAISQYGRLAKSDNSARSALDKLDSKAAAEAKTPTPSELATAKKPAAPRPGPDMLSLSNVAQKVRDEPGFDRAKVEAIKQAIQDGQYPLDPRRIAESFVAIEKMIRD